MVEEKKKKEKWMTKSSRAGAARKELNENCDPIFIFGLNLTLRKQF
jgi:hypothetical protein